MSKKNKNKNKKPLDAVLQKQKKEDKNQQALNLSTDLVKQPTQILQNTQQTKIQEQPTGNEEKTLVQQRTELTTESKQQKVIQQGEQIPKSQIDQNNTTNEAKLSKIQNQEIKQSQKEVQLGPEAQIQQSEGIKPQLIIQKKIIIQEGTQIQDIENKGQTNSPDTNNPDKNSQFQPKTETERKQQQFEQQDDKNQKQQQINLVASQSPKQQPSKDLSTQNLIQHINIAPVDLVDQPHINQSDLIDGLKYVGMAAQQIIYHNPLQHEAQARGLPTFTQNFQPAAFHLTQRLLQQLNIGTSPKQDQNKLLNVQGDDGLQQIRRSAESIDPDPLQLQAQVQDTKKVNILSSIHSQFSQQKEKRASSYNNQILKHQEDKNQQPQKQESIKSQKIKKSDHIIPIVPVTNPTYTNPLPTPHHQKHLDKPEDPVKEIDFDKINQKMLKQRQDQWKKMQQKELQMGKPKFVMAHQHHIPINIEPVLPNRPEKLQYTNNLPLIDKERTTQQHQRIIKQQSEIKNKLQQSEKLKKDATNDSPMKKLAVSALVTAACLGVCVLGKVDKRVTAGLSIASLISSYIVQK